MQFLEAHQMAMPIYGAIVFPFKNGAIQREGSWKIADKTRKKADTQPKIADKPNK